MKFPKKFIAVVLVLVSVVSGAFAGDFLPLESGQIIWRNDFNFYSDNTEFFEPFRLRETILGQQVKTFLMAKTGGRTAVRIGLFADHRAARDTETRVQPIFSFIHQAGQLENVMGALLPVRRHGLIEPMQVTTLELTRPVEYGTQLILENGSLSADAFLNWQNLLAPGSRETFDYGGSARLLLFEGISLGVQAHGYHVGGVTYYFPGIIRNNIAGGVGLVLESRFPLLGSSSLEAYGMGSSDSNRPGYPGPGAGQGIYFKETFSPIKDWKIFGIAWRGWDFMSEEGDPNYNSIGYDGVYYKSDRNYEEIGIGYSASVDPGVVFDFELRSHWVEDAWAHSLRITATVPFDIEIKNIHQAPRRRDSKKELNKGDDDQ